MALVATVDVWRCLTCGFTYLQEAGLEPDFESHAHSANREEHRFWQFLGANVRLTN